jgi:hypothetical protein
MSQKTEHTNSPEVNSRDFHHTYARNTPKVNSPPPQQHEICTTKQFQNGTSRLEMLNCDSLGQGGALGRSAGRFEEI